jgi:hypothetical protein
MATTTKTARLYDASQPSRDVAVLHLGDGTSLRARVAVLRELMTRPHSDRYVAYDVDDAGNRYNARVATRTPTFDVPASAVEPLPGSIEWRKQVAAVRARGDVLAGDNTTHAVVNVDTSALLVNEYVDDNVQARDLATPYLEAGLFTRVWRIVGATSDNGRYRVQVLDARVGKV